MPVPNPDVAGVNKTNECVANCPKGNGTATDNLNYGNCVNGCIAQYYYTTGVPQQGGAATTAPAGSTVVSPLVTVVTQSGTTFTTTTGSATITRGPSSTGSGSSSATSSTSRAAGEVLFAPIGSSLGLVGFLAAVLAL
jgi:hypothetical protein